MSEIKTKISTYNDVVDLFGEEKAADMLSEALDWSTIDPKNDKKNIMERKPLLLDPYMTYEDEDSCKHIVAGLLGDRDLDWASGYIDEEKIKNGQVTPADLKSALSMALDNELSTSMFYLDALSSQYAEIFEKFAGYIEFAGLARGVLVPGEYELAYDALNADVSERFNIQYGFQCDQMIDAMQFDMTLILTEKVDSMDGYRLIQSVCDWREENLEVIEDTCNLAIDEQITFSGYTENELVDMIGREDNGEDFVITGVGPRSLILTEKKDPDHGRRLSDKQAKVKTASDRLDAEREPKVDVPIHDKESK